MTNKLVIITIKKCMMSGVLVHQPYILCVKIPESARMLFVICRLATLLEIECEVGSWVMITAVFHPFNFPFLMESYGCIFPETLHTCISVTNWASALILLLRWMFSVMFTQISHLDGISPRCGEGQKPTDHCSGNWITNLALSSWYGHYLVLDMHAALVLCNPTPPTG